MRPIAPRIDGITEVSVAEDQLEYKALTVGIHRYEDGSTGIISRWTFTAEERQQIAAGADVLITQLNFGGPITPMSVAVHPAAQPERT